MPYPGLPQASIIPAPDNPSGPGEGIPSITNKFWAVATKRTEQKGVSTGLSTLSDPASGTLASGYTMSTIVVEYSNLPYPILTDDELLASGGIATGQGTPDEGSALANNGWIRSRFISRQRDPFSKVIRVPYGNAFVNGLPARYPIPLKEGGSVLKYTWHKVPMDAFTINPVNPLLSRISNSLGKINGSTFDGFPAFTLLLDNYYTREYQGTFGEWLSDVTYTIIYLPHPATGNEVGYTANTPLGWNFIYDLTLDKNNKPVFAYAFISDGEGSPIIAPVDFSTLFRP